MEYFTQISTYLFTLILAALIPGPGMTGLMFKTLTHGYKSGIFMLFGLITADLIFLSTSLVLIAYFNQLNASFSFYLDILCSFYLLYLAYQYWHFNGNLFNEISELNTKNRISAYRDGLLITLSNPKTISFYLALVPVIFGFQSLTKISLLLILFTGIILLLVGGLYIFGAVKLKMLLNQKTAQQILIKALACIMFGLACTILFPKVYKLFL
ncbi:LysE family translocator [Acinetobacter sp. Marseille-Q1618]|uniref:LysE family translocator n=1 Tax=Acinetobacter sp. Marseille-Q1618 TaxID=2697502 RepID=UPI00156E2C19|nr:LysE family translocator [Acinetobacter sp. Marseille-Q1618]